MQDSRHWKVAIGVGGALLAIQCASAILVYISFPDWQTRAQFGDVFGVVNALFSGLAFAGLVYAILLQREDLALQREELKLTRDELKRTATAQEQAEIALRAQADAANQSARLSAINFLLGHYQSERGRMRGAFPAGSGEDHRRQELLRRERLLSSMLDSLFEEVTTK